MMKKFLILLSLALLAMSCDKIEQPLKTSGITGGPDTSGTDEKLLLKKVLIEEFTGVTCNNCPLAAQDVKEILTLYPGRVVAMGIHAGGFSNPQPTEGYPDDLRTPEGNAIFSFANPAGVPSGMVDRLDHGSASLVKFRQSWKGEVSDILSAQDKTDITIKINASYDAASREASIAPEFSVINDLAGADLYWAAFIVENDVITAQKLPDNSKDPAYSQQHVLRTSFNNAAFGLPLALTTTAAGGTASEAANETLDNSWEAGNCHVIVYVYDNNTKAVLQVEEAHL